MSHEKEKDAFDRLREYAERYCGLWEYCKNAQDEAHEVSGMSRARRNAEKEADAERKAELTERMSREQSEVLRKLAASELAKLESKTYEVSEEERAEFDGIKADALEAWQEMRKCREMIYRTEEEAEKLIQTLVFGSAADRSKDSALMGQWLEGLEI